MQAVRIISAAFRQEYWKQFEPRRIRRSFVPAILFSAASNMTHLIEIPLPIT